MQCVDSSWKTLASYLKTQTPAHNFKSEELFPETQEATPQLNQLHG